MENDFYVHYDKADKELSEAERILSIGLI